jgi:hypothetical protein
LFYICALVNLSKRYSKVHIHQQNGVGINSADFQDFKYKFYVLNDPCQNLPLKWFECQPPVSKRIAIMIVQVEDDSHVNIIWAGNTWAYRGALDAAGKPGPHISQ